MRPTLLLLALVALAAGAAANEASPDAFLVARKWAGEPESEGRTVVGRRIEVTTEVFNAGSK